MRSDIVARSAAPSIHLSATAATATTAAIARAALRGGVYRHARRRSSSPACSSLRTVYLCCGAAAAARKYRLPACHLLCATARIAAPSSRNTGGGLRHIAHSRSALLACALIYFASANRDARRQDGWQQDRVSRQAQTSGAIAGWRIIRLEHGAAGRRRRREKRKRLGENYGGR